MPTKRRKIGARRIGGRLNERQRTFLLTGLLDRFGRGEPGFESDAAARAAWFRWRADLLEDRDFTVNDPGHRPAAFWRFEAGLTRDAFGWRWPRGCRSEEETTYKFYADATERAQIEAHWRLIPASAPPWFRRKHRAA